MDENKLAELISRTAVVLRAQERRCEALEARLHALSERIGGTTQQLPALLRKSADASLRPLSQQIIEQVETPLRSVQAKHAQQVAETGSALRQAGSEVAGQIRDLQRLHKRAIWSAMATASSALALLLIGAIWLSTHYANLIHQQKISVELLKAYNAADVTLCGGMLCANVDNKATRYGDKRQYLLVKPRPASP